MAEPDLLIEAGFSDAKLAREVAKVVSKYKQAGEAAEKAFKDASGAVGDNQKLRAHMRELDKLQRTYDPVYTATKKYESALKQLDRALEVGAIDQAKYTAEINKAQREMAETAGMVEKDVTRKLQGGADEFRNLGFQVQDFAVQVGAGTSATQAFAQQFPQLASGFGPAGIAMGTAAAVLVPLSAALISAAGDSKTLDERLGDLSASTDSMTAAVEAAATPVSILRDRYGDLADEVARANSAMAMMTSIRAQSDAMGAARGLSGAVGEISPVRSPGLSDREWAAVQSGIMADLQEKTGATADQVERLRMALNRTDSSNSLEAVARDAENLLQVISELYVGADEEQRRFLDTWGAQVSATMNAAKQQIEAAVQEENRLIETYDANTQRLKQLLADRDAAQAALAQAEIEGNAEKVESYQRVLRAIRSEVAEVNAAIAEIDGGMDNFVARMRGRVEGIAGSAKGALGGLYDRYAGPGLNAIQMIKDFEGYQSKAYWDVNAYRAGFGSDTVTRADGSVERVTKDTIVTLADANRDLARRIGEFQAAVISTIGPDRWAGFTQEQQGALTSIAYNYGSLPDRIVDAVLTGTSQDIATAIGRLAGDNGGINSSRRMREASAFGTTGAASAELQAAQRLAAEQQRALAPAPTSGRDALDRALERAMQMRDVSAETADAVMAQESAWTEIGNTLNQSLYAAVMQGEDLDDVLKRAALSLADMAAQALILGQGPFATGGGGGGGFLSGLVGSALGAFGGRMDPLGAALTGAGVSGVVPALPSLSGMASSLFAQRGAAEIIVRSEPGTVVEIARQQAATITQAALASSNEAMPSRVNSINRDPLRR